MHLTSVFAECASLRRGLGTVLAGVMACAVLVLGLPEALWTTQQPQRIALRPPSATLVGIVAFHAVTSTRELSDGSLLIADREDRSVLHARWDGSEPRSVGRVGDGPGEYRNIGRLYAMGRDSTLLTDEYLARWLVLRHARVVATISEGNELTRLMGGELGGAHHGSVLGFGDASRRPRADSLFVVLGHLASGGADTVARVKSIGGVRVTFLPPNERGMGQILAGNPLETEEQPLLFTDGWIAIARLDPYRVDWRDPAGRWVRGAPLPFQRIPVNRDERCWATRRVLPPEVPCAVDPGGWPDVIPAFVLRGPARALRSVLEAPDGRLVIARRASRAAPESRYDFVDRNGRLTGVLVLPANEAVLGFGRESIYVAASDTDGLATIRRHPWP